MSVITRVLPMWLTLFLLLTACAPTPPADDFAYSKAAFTASVRGTYTSADGDSHPIAARISVGAAQPGEPNRAMTLTFTQPPSLAGMTVTRTRETDSQGQPATIVTLTYPSAYGEIRASSQKGDFDGFLRFAEALLPMGDIESVSPVARDGTHTVTRRTSDGGREGVFLFSSDRELPLRVTISDGAERMELTVDE